MAQQAKSSSFLPHHHGEKPTYEKKQRHPESMNKHQGNEIEYRLIHILNRPYRSGQEGEQTMKQNTKQHRVSP